MSETVDLEKNIAELINKKIDEVKSGNDSNVAEFKIENEKTINEFKAEFEKNFNEFKTEFGDEFKKMQEEIKTDNSNSIAVGMASAFKAITSTQAFKDQLKTAKTNKNEFRLDIYNVMKAVKEGDAEKGLNVYGEDSDNGLTDTNIFEASTPAQALDALWAFINADHVEEIKLQSPFIFPYISISPTNKPVYTYSEIVPKIPVNTYAGYKVVKEGGLKPTQDLAISNSKTKAIKLAKGMVYTLELEEDIPNWSNMVRNLLSAEYALAQQDAILKYVDVANPTSPNNGILNNNVGFDASKVQKAIPNPTLIDVIKAISAQVNTTKKYNYGLPFKPNAVFLNPLTYEYEIGMLKDTQGNYNAETDFMTRLQREYGITIVLRDEIPVGKIAEGDFKKFQVKPYKPFSLRIAYIDDMAIHNQTLTIAEGRHIQFLPVLDKPAIVYTDISVVKTALAAGPTPAP